MSTSPPNLERQKPTSLDYGIAALAPVFIIGMIGSLVYFLVTVVYQGEYVERLMWILGLYTFASVLIARIAIEQSRAHAYTYMIALGAATMLVTPRFFVVEGILSAFSFPILVTLLALIAYLADRITFDCTVVNEKMMSSGEGLLQSLGLVKSDQREIQKAKSNKAIDNTTGHSAEKRARKHNPGVWVLYFAMLALPLFGLGQLVIRDAADRRWAFFMLFTYLVSSFSLLVLISLLSLRKYLRDRNVAMDTEFAVRWIAMGIVSVVLLVGLLALIPLPSQSGNWLNSPIKITSQKNLESSKWGWGREAANSPNDPKNANQAPARKPQANNAEQNNNNAGNKNAAAGPNGTAQSNDQKGSNNTDAGSSGDKNNDNGSPSNGSQSQNSQSASNQQNADSKRSSESSSKQNSNPQSSSSDKKSGQLNGGEDRQKNSTDGSSQPNSESDNNTAAKKDSSNSKNSAASKSNPGDSDDGQQDKAKGNPSDKLGDKNSQENKPENKPVQKSPNGEKPKDNQQKGEQQPPPPANDSKPQQQQQQQQQQQTSWSLQWDFGALVQWIVMILLGIVVAFFGWKNRQQIIQSVKEFLDWLSGFFGGGKKGGVAAVDSLEQDETAIAEPFPPFRSFSDPFGAAAARWSREQIVQHMYRAVLSWGYERRIMRRDEETPDEYLRRLSRRFSAQQEALTKLGSLYSRIAYSRGTVRAEELQPLADLWRWLKQQPVSTSASPSGTVSEF